MIPENEFEKLTSSPPPGSLQWEEEPEDTLTDEEISLSLSPDDWFFLIQTLKSGLCTPFLGAGASSMTLRTGADIAREWAKKHNYPMEDSDDLPKVAQFMAVKYRTARLPKTLMAQIVSAASHPSAVSPYDPHTALAELELPLYITTNYDNFMTKALQVRKGEKQVQVEILRWNNGLSNLKSVFDDPNFSLTPERPLVYHLHGNADNWQSLVLTESDYIDFLVNTAASRELVPPVIRGAIAGTSLLFLGYRLADLNFRVLFQAICGSLEDSVGEAHISVQLPPFTRKLTKDQRKARIEYLNGYFSKLNVKVFWGNCETFVKTLRQKQAEYSGNVQASAATGLNH